MLYIVSTPIGNIQDISERALACIKSSDLIIGEERKVTTSFLKKYKLTGRPIELLNEHSDKSDLEFLLDQCKNQVVSLISDCGTPGFCDPGADLVYLCRQNDIQVVPVPGASSLMTFLSVCGHRLDQFYFRGFLPANNEKREVELKALQKESRAVIIMDTPYRLEKTLGDMKKYFPKKVCIIGYKLTQEEEQIIEGYPDELAQLFLGHKGEFILLIK